MRFKRLIFSALLCFAGVYCTPVFADTPAEDVVVETGQNLDNTQITDQQNEESLEEEIIETDEQIDNISEQLDEFGWCPDDNITTEDTDDNSITLENETENTADVSNVNRGSDDDRHKELCKMLKEAKSLEKELAGNTQELEENYKNMKDKETSFENRMLGAAGIGTVGIGGMMAASALAEQSADKQAETDMQAYLATFQCKAGDNRYSGGTKSIELGGANQLIDLYTQYATLAADLKERKNALGLKAGIESEILIDKASGGLYDDIGTGIGSGAYASIARALQNPDGDDAKKWAEQKESTANNLKIGATVAAAGAVATMAANYAINHNNKNKSDELLRKRDEIKKSFDTLSQTLIDECNKTIQEHKDFASTLTSEQLQDPELQEYKQDVDATQPVSTLSELWSSMFCK